MIVDDSATARIHVRTVLQGLGFSQFLEVPDGAHAIAMAARESCDLIVTDYNMPLMDGRALVSYLKQNPATAAIPIMMVTTETDPQGARSGAAVGRGRHLREGISGQRGGTTLGLAVLTYACRSRTAA